MKRLEEPYLKAKEFDLGALRKLNEKLENEIKEALKDKPKKKG